MRFDSNKAWQDALAAVAANREVLWALAGVFFILPGIAFSLAFPQPEPAPGANAELLFAQLITYWADAAPWMVVTGVVQLLGTLTALTLFTDSSRPTVAQAIRMGAAALPTVLAAQVLVGLAFGLVAVVLLAIGTLIGSTGLTTLLTFLVVMILLYLFIRTILIAPVAVVDGVRAPATVLRRAWALTAGNVGALSAFFVLLILAAGVVLSLIMLIVGTVLTLVAGPEVTRILAALASNFLMGGATLYVIAILAAIHRQLAASAP